MQAIAELGLVLLSAALAVVLSAKLRLPHVAALLIAGMVVGPNVLHLVQLPTIEAFADIGAVLLLFMIGVEFSIAKLLAGGMRPVVASLLIMLMTFVLMHEAAVLLGFGAIAALYVAAIFSMSSTAIMMKILEQKRLVERQETPMLVTILIIEDILAVFMLTFFSSFNAGAAGSVPGALALSLCVLAFGYVVLQVVFRKLAGLLAGAQSEDALIFFSFTLGIGMSVLASLLGLTPAIGAFLAGSIIAGLPNGRQFEQAVRPFSHLFAPFFFLSIGMLINPPALLASAGTAAVLICLFMATVFVASSFSFFLVSSSGRSSIFVGLAMLPLGEFSLLIAKEGAGAAGADLVGMASAGVLLTSIACSLALNRSDTLYLSLKRVLPPPFLGALRDASGYFRNVMSAFEPHGYFHKLLMHELRAVGFDAAYLTGAFLLLWLGRPQLQFSIGAFGAALPADTLLACVLALLSLIPAARILHSAKKMFDALAVIFSRTTPQANKVALARNLGVAALFFLLFANSPLIVDALLLPRALNWLSPVFLALSMFFMWSAIRAASFWFFLQERTPINLLRSRVTTSANDLIVVASASAGRKKGRRKKVLFLR